MEHLLLNYEGLGGGVSEKQMKVSHYVKIHWQTKASGMEVNPEAVQDTGSLYIM